MHYFRQEAIVDASICAFFTLMVTIAIVQTIITNPGGIPVNKEWDIVTSDSQGGGGDQSSEDDIRSSHNDSVNAGPY